MPGLRAHLQATVIPFVAVTISRLHDFTTSRLHDFTISRSHDLTTSRSHDLTISRLMKLAALTLILTVGAHQSLSAQARTADPAARGIALTEFPRIVKLADNVYGYEEIRQPGFTTVSLDRKS